MAKRIDYTLQRVDGRTESTYGILFDKDKLHKCFVIEDPWREVKVSGETRIPAGTYQIKHREVLSGMTKKYREKFSWFNWHLELQNVPNFKYIYGHIGNKSSHSEGCLLFNKNVSEVDGQWVGGNSKEAFEEVYKEMSYYLDQGYEVYITIRDEEYLKQPF